MSTRDLPLPRLRPRVLREEVLDALRKAILSNELEPGARLPEAEAAARMGVSRGPVREAIRQLEQEGLVEFFPHRGVVVVGLPDDELDAIYEMRALIEAQAMQRACTRASEEDFAELEAIIDDMRGALDARDIDQLADADLRFHDKIISVSGFTLLRKFWSSLTGLVRVRSYQALGRPGQASEYFFDTAISSHQALVDALRRGNGKRAAAAVREHILEVAAVLAKGDG